MKAISTICTEYVFLLCLYVFQVWKQSDKNYVFIKGKPFVFSGIHKAEILN